MKIYKLLLFLSLIIYSYNIASQNDSWSPSTIKNLEDKVTKTEGTIIYFVDPQMSVSDRNNLVEVATEYIEHNLKLINESYFSDSLYIVIARNKEEMIKYAGPISGVSMLKNEYIPQNMVCCIPKVLKHELMHMVLNFKWRPLRESEARLPEWLVEGIAVYADPEVEYFTDLNLEEMYALFNKSNKLLELDLLNEFPSVVAEDPTPIKIAYIQSGYIVQFLIEKYGIMKLKELWISTSSFQEIYGMSLNAMIEEINKEMDKKYPNSIKFDWEEFSRTYD